MLLLLILYIVHVTFFFFFNFFIRSKRILLGFTSCLYISRHFLHFAKRTVLGLYKEWGLQIE